MNADRESSAPSEITCYDGVNGIVQLYEPVGPGLCGRCRKRPEDICFDHHRDGVRVGGGALCSACLIVVLGASQVERPAS